MAIAKLDEWVSTIASTLTRTVSASTLPRTAIAFFATRHTTSQISRVTGVDFGGQPMVRLEQRSHQAGAVRLHVSAWALGETQLAARTDDIITPTYNRAPAEQAMAAAVFTDVDRRLPFLEHPTDAATASTPNPFTTLSINCHEKAFAVAAIASVPASTVSWQADMTEAVDVTNAQLTFSVADGNNPAGGPLTIEPTVASQNRSVALSLELRFGYRQRLSQWDDGKTCVCGHRHVDHGVLIEEPGPTVTYLEHFCYRCAHETWEEDLG